MRTEIKGNIKIEYGEEDLKQILGKLLKEQYINYITQML